MDMDLKPNFTPRAQEAIISARKIAGDYDRRMITAAHLCYSLATLRSGTLESFYNACGATPENFVNFLKTKLTRGDRKPKGKPYFSSDFKKVLGQAVLQAEQYEHDYVGIEHILLSVYIQTIVHNHVIFQWPVSVP